MLSEPIRPPQPPSPGARKYKVAVLGATGVVGQRFLCLLSGHPWFDVVALAASPRSVGRKFGDAVQWRLAECMPEPFRQVAITACTVNEATRACDLVFSALDADVAKSIESAFRDAGIPVFSNTKCFRMDPTVPLIAPTANPDHLCMVKPRSGFIVANPNCSTTGLVVVLKALAAAFGPLAQVQVVTMQALSGAGYPGMAALDVLDNVVPYIEGEEEKLETETRKILGTYNAQSGTLAAAPTLLSAACHRVPVVDGHLLSVAFSFVHAPAPRPDEIAAALRAYAPSVDLTACPSYAPPLFVFDDAANPDRPQPRLDRSRHGGMTVSVGRIRRCPLLGFKLVLLVHNTVLGAAGSALLNAEMAAVHGYLRA